MAVKAPIYQDTIYTASTSDIRFRINGYGKVLYEGRSKARPGESYAEINISKICQQYMNNSLQGKTIVLDTSLLANSAYTTFTLTYSNPTANTWSTGETYTFLYDWDYDWDINLSISNTLSNPVNGHYAYGQYKANTIFNGTLVANSFTSANTNTYCGDYALIYLNMAGGWDSFLMEGVCKQIDQYETYNYVKKFNNTVRTDFGKVDYLKEITNQWVLNTGYLNEVESRILAKNMFSSIECYLQDLKTGKLYPVVITDTQVEYKEYHPSDNSPVNYTITVNNSQTKTIY